MKKEISVNVDFNVNLNGFYWTSDEVLNSNIVIVVVHGMAEHIERYDELANFFNKNGYPVYGYDHRGHKLSITEHYDYGYMSDKDNFTTMVDDLFKFLEFVKMKEPTKKILIFGHSMGAFITQRATQLNKSNFDYAILSGIGFNSTPLLFFGYTISKVITFFKGRKFKSKFINALSFKKYNKKILHPVSEFDWLSSDKNEVDKYLNDPFCGGVFSVSFFKDFFNGMIIIKKNLKRRKNKIPILFISGKEDPVGQYGFNVTKLINTMDKIGYNDIQLNLYFDCRHELINDRKRLIVFADLLEWIKKLH